MRTHGSQLSRELPGAGTAGWAKREKYGVQSSSSSLTNWSIIQQTYTSNLFWPYFLIDKHMVGCLVKIETGHSKELSCYFKPN